MLDSIRRLFDDYFSPSSDEFGVPPPSKDALDEELLLLRSTILTRIAERPPYRSVLVSFLRLVDETILARNLTIRSKTELLAFAKDGVEKVERAQKERAEQKARRVSPSDP